MYVPGDHYMICERTGFKYRRSEMRKEWTGAWVHKSVFNERHPQDFVKAIPDDPSVDVSRPDVAPAMGETTLSGTIAKDAEIVWLADDSGLEEYDPIGIELDSGVTHWTFISDGKGIIRITEAKETRITEAGDPRITEGIILHAQMPGAATSGNTVYLPSRNNERWE